MQLLGSFSIAADHPSLPGHFPSGPIVPGVVLLDAAFALILAAHPGRTVAAMPSVKFVRPVLPDQVVTVACRAVADHAVTFTCTVVPHVVLHGSIVLGADS